MLTRVSENWTIAMAGVLALASLAGCSATPPPVVGQNVVPAAMNDAQAEIARTRDTLLRPGDVITVTVFREPGLSLEETPIAADGTVAVPLVGTLAAQGRSPGDLARAIEDALTRGRYLNNPQVAVNVARYASHRVTVEGAVKQPGVYTFAPGERLSSALAQAQGFTRVSKLDQVAVFRPTPDGMTVARFDYQAIQQGTMIDPGLEPGDRVVVGTSGRSQLWQDLLQSLPVLAIFTRI